MTSTKFQINYNVQKFNNQNSFDHPSIWIRTNLVSFASLHMTERNPYGRTPFSRWVCPEWQR